MENRSPPMIKRVVPLMLTLFVMVSVMAVPTMADDVNWYDLLDYGLPVGYDGYRISLDPVTAVTEKRIYFENPGGYFVNQCEIVFRTDDTSPEMATGSGVLTVENLYADVYRAYGYINSSDELLRVSLTYDDGTYIEFLRFDVSNVRWDWNYLTAYAEIDAEVLRYLTYTRTMVDAQWTETNDTSDISYWTTMTFDDWKRYDYIELVLEIHATEINSIDVSQGTRVIDYSVSDYGGNISGKAQFYLTLRIDLSDADKIASDTLKVMFGIQGVRISSGVNMFRIHSCRGVYESGEPNFFVYWFQKIINALGGSADTSEMQTDVDNIKDQMESASDTMADFTRPAVEDVFTEVDLDTEAGTPFADMMAAFFENDFIVTIIRGSLAFTLFGILVG